MKTDFSQLDLQALPSPCFVVDEAAVEANLKILNQVANDAGVKILHALKAFSMWSVSELTLKYLNGTCSSGLHEALLAKEFYQHSSSGHAKGEIHVFAAGFTEADLTDLLEFADHVVFNSPSQIKRFAALCLHAKQTRGVEFGLRINPEHSEGATELYDPCAKGSRLGTTREQLDTFLADPEFNSVFFELISGLHFHTLCEQGFEPLNRTLNAVFAGFEDILKQLKWLNMGGGHHITAPGYNTAALVSRLKQIKQDYGLELYLEPGEAVAIGSGVLVSEVLDLGFNQLNQAILDTSATCHMPDTLEMPYKAQIYGAKDAHELEHTYRLGGLTCLAGDVMGDYSFARPLEVGQRLMFMDMSHYTMVKTSTFNGTKLPALVLWNSASGSLKVVKTFDYVDFRDRLS